MLKLLQQCLKTTSIFSKDDEEEAVCQTFSTFLTSSQGYKNEHFLHPI